MKKQSEYPIIGQNDDPVVFNGNLAWLKSETECDEDYAVSVC